MRANAILEILVVGLCLAGGTPASAQEAPADGDDEGEDEAAGSDATTEGPGEADAEAADEEAAAEAASAPGAQSADAPSEETIILVAPGQGSEPVAATTVTEEPVPGRYSRARGLGMFHDIRFLGGALSATTPIFEAGMAVGSEETRMYTFGADLTFLRFPSSFGNFHGIEISGYIRGKPIDFSATIGTALTLFNIGSGGPLSIRVGGRFGVGYNLAHALAYVGGRVAIVLIRDRLDVEVRLAWTPPGASSHDYDERHVRASAWYRFGEGATSLEVFVETLERVDAGRIRPRQIEDGFGAGLAIAL